MTTFVNSVFVFAPDGGIRICTLNAPGTFHDSTMAEYSIYQKMEQLHEEYGVKVVVDIQLSIYRASPLSSRVPKMTLSTKGEGMLH